MVGFGLLVVALIAAVVLVITGDSEDSGVSDEEIELSETLNVRQEGLTAAYPEGWERSERQGIINLESPDRCVAVSLSAPVPAGQARDLQSDTIAGLRRSFRKAQVRRQPRARPIGGAPTSSALAVVRAKGGRGVVVRTSVSRGRRLAHLTQMVIRDPRCTKRLAEGQAIIESIQFTR